MILPSMLPDEPPAGWKKRMTCHLNFGGGKCAASYEVRNGADELMPIRWIYNTREGIRGFTLPDVDAVMTWKELREAWPAYLERMAAAESQAGGKP